MPGDWILCPRCNQNLVKAGEKLCEKCLKALDRDEKDVEDADDKWKEFLDDEEEYPHLLPQRGKPYGREGNGRTREDRRGHRLLVCGQPR